MKYSQSKKQIDWENFDKSFIKEMLYLDLAQAKYSSYSFYMGTP